MKFPGIRTGLGALAAGGFAIFVFAQSGPAAAQAPANDYPTQARADYVFGCMEANEPNPITLRKCSCSIDVIASVLPYEDYERAETVLSVVQAGGERVSALRSPSQREIVANLRRAQAEAEVRCF
jgi:hypothetical protein